MQRIDLKKPLVNLTKGFFILLIGISLLGFSNHAQAKTVKLKWKPVDRANAYSVELAQDESFSEVYKTFRSQENRVAVELPSGVYYLRVQSVNKWGVRGDWSAPFKLTVTEKGSIASSKESVFEEDNSNENHGRVRTISNRQRVYVGLGHGISEDL
jgi:hypothetical protein